MIPDDFIQTLLARTDIVEVIDRRVPLKKAGANYVACCPFHQEKTPSFSVSPGKQFYHCFGCGAHGTAIKFLMEFAGLSFQEAIESLARDAGLQVPQVQSDPNRPAVRRNPDAPDLAEIMATAAKFYRMQLKQSPRAVEYLKKRGLSGEIAKRFGIGYAPDGWNALRGVFDDYDKLPLAELGMVIERDDGGVYDRFRDRIMFPIHSPSGKVIGFGGRVLDKGEPKYLNSPETPLFSKGRELYGLYQAREAIQKAGRVLVVEGYMDVVALAQYGVDYCVATLGTSTTPTHTQKLYRLTDHVIFSFDGDSAGRKAAWRALANTLPVLADGKRASFLFLPDDLDPDEFVRTRGREAFEEAVANAVPLSEYLLEQTAKRHPPDSFEERAAFVNEVMPLIKTMQAPTLATLLRRRVAAMTGLSEGELQQNSAPARTSQADAPRQRTRPAFPPGRRASPPSITRTLLRMVLQQPQLAVTHEIPPADEASPEARTLNAMLAYCRAAETIPPTAAVLQHFSGTAHERLIQETLTLIERDPLPDEENTLQFLAALNLLTARNEKKTEDTVLSRPLNELTDEEKRILSRIGKTPDKLTPPVKPAPPPPPAVQRPAPKKPAPAPAPADPLPFNPFDEEPPPF